MNIKHDYNKIVQKLLSENIISPSEYDVIKQKDFIPIIGKIVKNSILYENDGVTIYKKDQLIGIKIDDYLIKIIFDSYETNNSMIIPFSIDEGENILKTIIDSKKDEKEIFVEVFDKLTEKQKRTILNKLKQSNEKLYYYLNTNYPLIERVSGMIDDPIMKACEKMNNQELVSIMLMLTVKERRKILRNVSSKRKRILLDEMHYLGYFKKSERLKAKNKFIKLLKEFLDEYSHDRSTRV